VGALADVWQLLRVAEQDDGRRSSGHRERVGKRDLAGLVDEEHVDGLAHVSTGHVNTGQAECQLSARTAAMKRRPGVGSIPKRSA
jgi:hypothetical protein